MSLHSDRQKIEAEKRRVQRALNASKSPMMTAFNIRADIMRLNRQEAAQRIWERIANR